MPDDPTPRWSLADTHCVWCGKQKATKAAKDRYTAEVDHPCPEGCWCDAFCWDDCLGFDEDPARIAASLRAAVEAQGKVIDRYAEFVAAYDAAQLVTESFAFHVSARDRLERAREALYGEVVNEEAGE